MNKLNWKKRSRRVWSAGARRDSDRRSGSDDADVLAILEDVDNGNVFYVSIVDSFSFAGRYYAAMSIFEPVGGRAGEPEFILMRFDTGENGERYYQSIRNKRELEAVFDIFFKRYIQNIR